MLTPSKLQPLKSNSCLPLDVFTSHNMYSKHWRQAQCLANSFWKRWMKEYLPTLQSRQKWTSQRRNLAIGDLVWFSSSMRSCREVTGWWDWLRKCSRTAMATYVMLKWERPHQSTHGTSGSCVSSKESRIYDTMNSVNELSWIPWLWNYYELRNLWYLGIGLVFFIRIRLVALIQGRCKNHPSTQATLSTLVISRSAC